MKPVTYSCKHVSASTDLNKIITKQEVYKCSASIVNTVPKETKENRKNFKPANT